MTKRGAELARAAQLAMDDDEIEPEVHILDRALAKRSEAVQNPEHYNKFLSKELAKEEYKKSESEDTDHEEEIKQKEKGKKRNACQKKSHSKKQKRTNRCAKKTKEDKVNKGERLLDSDHSSSDSSSTSIDLSKKTRERLKKIRKEHQRLLDSSSDSSSTPIVLSKETQEMLKNLREEHKKEIEFLKNSITSKDSDCEVLDSDNVTCVYDTHNKEINVKVLCRGKLLNKTIKRADNFSQIYCFVAKECEVQVSKVRLYFDDRLIAIEDTPNKLNLRLGHIIDGCIFGKSESSSQDANVIDIKLQSKDSKVKTTISLHKLEPMSVMMEKYAVQKSLPLSKLVFEFDGDKILPDQMASDLDMENGSCIDVKIRPD